MEAPADRIALLHNDLDLQCSVINSNTGNSLGLNVKWKFNNGLLNPKSLLYPNGTLIIPAVIESDLGSYTCLVYNDTNSALVLTAEPVQVFTICMFLV